MTTMLRDSSTLEAHTQTLGRELFQLAEREHEHLTTLNRWTKQVLMWCLSDQQLKAQVLRFIDCLPMLRTPQAIARHLRDYFPTDQLRLPTALRLGVALSRPGLLTAHAASFVVRQLVEQVARQFIASAVPEEALRLVTRLASQGVMVSFDLLGERVVSELEADQYAQRYTTLIQEFSAACRGVRVVAAHRQTRPAVHVSIKPSSLSSHVDPLSFEDSLERILRRLRPIAALAAEIGAAITLDMEQYEVRDLTLELAKRLLTQPGLGERLALGIVIQAYLCDSEAVVTELLEWLTRHHRRLAIRLVKGAYWDYEVAQARQREWTIPVYREKWETDQAFERLTERLLSAQPTVQTEIASHNLRSIAHAMAVAESLGLSKDQLEFQLLYGMGDAIQGAISRLGYPVRVYTPVGELIPGMAYLVRRILENTANESFLRQEFLMRESPEALLAAPTADPSTPPARVASQHEAAGGARDSVPRAQPLGLHEPVANFSTRSAREQFTRALEQVRRDVGGDYPLLLGGQEVQTARSLPSVNPAHPGQRIGQVAQAGVAEVDRAVDIAHDAQRRWARTSVSERVVLLRRAAQLLRQRRCWFSALEVLEVGKPWREADADVVEAIEYLEYYSARMEEFASGRVLPQRPGESNRYLYTPRGVCAVIAPWNFPLAILTGMSSAALVAGNVVILKPAEQSPVIAYHWARLLHEAGIPSDVVQYLPGLGEEAGKALVEHPRVHVIMFTGSKAVGLSILEAASTVSDGQRFVKHVVTEMGGKNALIVDEDADLDEALKGILVSAFSYQGQKCSAASRLIVHDALYEPLVERLIGAADGLIVCDPALPSCDLGPLIDADALERVTRAIARGAQSATLRYQYPSGRLPGEGFFCGPALCAGVDPASAFAQAELFGPLLCLFRVGSFAEALDVANDTDYGLTGGVYSRSPSHIQQACEAFEVGNLYINRPITGAVVGRQPFGGSKLSGLGTKAGGPDYLLQLMIPKTICENTARHGMPLE